MLRHFVGLHFHYTAFENGKYNWALNYFHEKKTFNFGSLESLEDGKELIGLDTN